MNEIMWMGIGCAVLGVCCFGSFILGFIMGDKRAEDRNSPPVGRPYGR